MSKPAPAGLFEAERVVDLRTLWNRLTARWWLVVAGLVIGAIVGVLVLSSPARPALHSL